MLMNLGEGYKSVYCFILQFLSGFETFKIKPYGGFDHI